MPAISKSLRASRPHWPWLDLGTSASCPAAAFNLDRFNAFALILPCARQVAVSEPAHYSGVPGCTGWG